MIKGCRKNVIMVKGGCESPFESAYFIMKDSVDECVYTEGDMISEAERIISHSAVNKEKAKSGSSHNNNEKKRSKALIPFAVGTAVGSAAGLIWLFI